MNAEFQKYYANVIAECEEGLCRWDTAAWYLTYDITETGDASLFDLATSEMEKLIFENIQIFQQQGHYRVLALGVGEVDHTQRMQRLVSLLEQGGYLRSP